MKKTFPLLLVLLLLIACSSPQQDSSASQQEGDLSSVQTMNSGSVPNTKDVQGYYVKSAHEGAWLLFLKQEDSTLKGYLVQYGGMLPPHEFLDSPDAEEDMLQKFEIEHLQLDSKGQRFNSNLGTGSINAQQVVFEEVMDEGQKLILVRAATYPYIQ